jgi:hypothetical protein
LFSEVKSEENQNNLFTLVLPKWLDISKKGK